jgi:KTSC domain
MDLLPVKSGPIRAIGWEAGRMRIEFSSGDTWEYGNDDRPVPEAEYRLLRDAPSIGSRWYAIKGLYPGVKVEERGRVVAESEQAPETLYIDKYGSVSLDSEYPDNITTVASLPANPGPTPQAKCPQCGGRVITQDGQQYCAGEVRLACPWVQRLGNTQPPEERPLLGNWDSTARIGRW